MRKKRLVGLAGFALAGLLACTTGGPGGPDKDGLPTKDKADVVDQVVNEAGPPPPPPAPLASPVVGFGMAREKMSAPTAGMMPPPYIQPMPGDIDREKYPDAKPNPVKAVKTDPISTFSIDVDTASYGVTRRYLNDGVLPPKDAVRLEELINYFDYDYPAPTTKAQPFQPIVSMAPSPWGKGKDLLRIAIQGYDIPKAARPPLNLVLLLDVSGSMSDENKLPLVKKSIKLMLDDMSSQDKIGIVVYAGAAGEVLPPTPASDKAKIVAALDQLNAGGSTAGGEGLLLAYSLAEANFKKGAVNRVMIATDGDFNVGIADPDQLEDFVARKRETGIYLSVLGFGGGNYNDALMQKLAQSGNGIAAYVDTLTEARKVLHDDFAGNLFPIADDVKIQVEFNLDQVAEYRLIGYETRLLNEEDFKNDKVDAGEIGAGASVTALYEVTPVGGPTLRDERRYDAPAKTGGSKKGEIAFLKIRYKLPGEKVSKLIERPVTVMDRTPAFDSAGKEFRFAAAVAGYGQLMRGDPYLDQGFGYDQVLAIAQAAKGDDAFGYRAEFINLVRAAKAAEALKPLERDGQSESGPPPMPMPNPRPMPH
ncbi:MAG: VWA domain-containing protein [Caulobacterales bacterium]